MDDIIICFILYEIILRKIENEKNVCDVYDRMDSYGRFNLRMPS